MSAPPSLEIEVTRCPYRLSTRGRGTVSCARAAGCSPGPARGRGAGGGARLATAERRGRDPRRSGGDECTAEALEQAVARMRFALAVDDDLRPFYAEFKRDPFIGPAIRRRPWLRPRRRLLAWEALVWAITEQLIESSRAAVIQRRMVRRWGVESRWRSGHRATSAARRRPPRRWRASPRLSSPRATWPRPGP